MDSSDSGPPPSKRFLNGNHEGQGRPSDSDSPGGHPGRGSRGMGFSRGRGGGFRGGFRSYSGQKSATDDGGSVDSRPGDWSTGSRGRGSSPFRGRGSTPFRGRGRSTSLSSHDDQAPGFRGGRGSFRSRGSFSGFRGGRGGSPFRGRGFPSGRRGAFGLRGRGRGSGRPEVYHCGPNYEHFITIYNLHLPNSHSVFEQREFVRGVVSEYKCFDIKIISHADALKAICLLRDEDAVKKACNGLNGRFVEGSQILVTGVGKRNPRNIPLVIKNFPESATFNNLVEALHECKAVSLVSMTHTVSKSFPQYVFVFVNDEDDVARIMDKSTKVKGSKLVTKRLDPNLVARSSNDILYEKWVEILGSDIVYYVNKAPEFTDIYFESSADFEAAFKKVEEFNTSHKEKISFQRRYLHDCFFAEVCDVEGDVNDVELYSLVRKHGEISEFKRLDKDYYMIKQELSAAMAAMSLSDSKGCGGTLKFSWRNTRLPEPVEETPKEKKKKNKKNKKSGDTESNDDESTEEAGDNAKSSNKIEEMEDDDEEEDDDDEEEDDDDDEEEEDDEEEDVDDEEVDDEEVDDEEDDDEDDDDDEEEELEEDEESDSHKKVLVTQKQSKKNEDLIRQVPETSSNVKQDRRPKKRKISTSA